MADVVDGALEAEMIRAGRLAESMGLGNLFDVSGRVFDAMNAELDARREFKKRGISWPTSNAVFWNHAHTPNIHPQEPLAFVRERWGEGLVAVLAKRRREDIRAWDALESPTVRRLLLILEEGLRRQRPEFETIARKVAALFGPPPRKGNRPRMPMEEAEKLDHAAFLWHHFKAIYRWLDANMPEETDRARLLARLRRNRPYMSALQELGPIGGAEVVHEKAMLPFIAACLAEERLADGMREATAINRGFTAFCVKVGLAPKGAVAGMFVRTIRKEIRSKFNPRRT